MFLFAEAESVPSLMDVLLDPHYNVLNWILLVALLCWIWVKYGAPAFKSREESIASTIKTAEKAKQDAAAFLKEQKERVAKAEKTAADIVAEQRQAAEQMRAQIEEQTKKDVADLKVKFESAIANERQRVVTEMRSAAVKAALTLCEEQLKTSVTPTVKARLLNQFMEQLENHQA
jgi:F-type H+-transporting ATPase subunit b